MTEPKIKAGRIAVNDVYQIIDHEDVKVFLVDTKSKYFELTVGYVFDRPIIEVDLLETKETLYPDREQKKTFTRLTFDLEATEDQRWHALVDGGRYEAQIALFRTEVSQ